MYARNMSRKPYPSDLTDEQWAFIAPYLTLMKEDAPQREHSLRDVFNALRWLARAGASWRMLPHDFPPWAAVYQQFRRWNDAGCFEAMVNDMRCIIRTAQGRESQPSAMVLDGVLSRNRRKFRQPINVACPAPGRWGRPNSRVTSRHFDHGNASRTSRPDCSGLDEAD